MASLIVEGGELVVRMSGWERAAAFRGDISMPLLAVRFVGVEPDPWSALRGIRAPGTLDPPSEFGRLLVTVADVEQTVAAVRSAAGL